MSRRSHKAYIGSGGVSLVYQQEVYKFIS